MPPHDDDDDDIIILSVSLPAECAVPLDNLAAAGKYGSSREEVAHHYLCRALGANPKKAKPELPEQAADAAVAATGGDTPAGPKLTE